METFCNSFNKYAKRFKGDMTVVKSIEWYKIELTGIFCLPKNIIEINALQCGNRTLDAVEESSDCEDIAAETVLS